MPANRSMPKQSPLQFAKSCKSAPETPRVKRPRILVIDNNPVYCEILSEYLTGHGYEVVPAHTVAEGREQLHKGRWALAVIDYRLERADDKYDHSGVHLAREATRTFPVPKIILTRIDSTEYARKALRPQPGRAPAADFLLKHLPLRDIHRAIEDKIVRAKSFLSYARPDRERVIELSDQLREAGFEPWMDDETPAGMDWEFEIKERLREADIVLAYHSQKTDDRRGYRRREVQWALEIKQEKLESDIYLIPVRFEECQLDSSLERLQRIDLFGEDGFRKLAASIREGKIRAAL